MSRRVLLALLPLLLAMAGATGNAYAADDEILRCVESCKELIKSGDMIPGYSETGCQVRVCHEQARKFYEKAEYDKALASLDQILPHVEFSPAYQLTRGMVNYAMGHFELALKNFDTVLEIRPYDVQGSAQRAHTLVRVGRVPEARAQFQEMLSYPEAQLEYKKLRTSSYIYGNLGVLRLMQSDLAGGKQDLAKALEIDGRNRLARTFSSQIVPALEDRTLAYAMLPHLVAAFEELALRKPREGLRELTTVLDSSPNFRLGHLLAAETQRRYMDFKGCEVTLRIAESRFPDDTEVFANRIRCTMLRHGIRAPESQDSINELKALANRDPNDPLVQEMMELLSQ